MNTLADYNRLRVAEQSLVSRSSWCPPQFLHQARSDTGWKWNGLLAALVCEFSLRTKKGQGAAVPKRMNIERDPLSGKAKLNRRIEKDGWDEPGAGISR